VDVSLGQGEQSIVECDMANIRKRLGRLRPRGGSIVLDRSTMGKINDAVDAQITADGAERVEILAPETPVRIPRTARDQRSNHEKPCAATRCT